MKTTFSVALAIVGAQATDASHYGGSSSYYPSSHTNDPWGHSNSHGHGHSHPDADADNTWYNQYQQYRTPKLSYRAAKPSSTTYAICPIDSGFTLQFAQIPGRATQVRINKTALPSDISQSYGFRIHEFGKIYPDENNNECGNVGDVFNPLCEKDSYGRKLLYQDPSRGTIDCATADGSGAFDNVQQSSLLQNLSGYNSLIGRSIAIYSCDGTTQLIADDATPIACCTIGYDMSPMADEDTEPTHHHHNHGHYGGYGSGSGHGSGYGSGSSHYGSGSSHGSGYGSGYGNNRYGSPSYSHGYSNGNKYW